MSALEKVGSYRKLRLPDTRRITIDMLDATSRKHWMSGLIEVDVTRAREALDRMAGFVSRLAELLEGAYGLEEGGNAS